MIRTALRIFFVGGLLGLLLGCSPLKVLNLLTPGNTFNKASDLKYGNDPRNRLANDVSEQLKQHFGDKVYRAVIPRNVRLSEAPSHGLPALVAREILVRGELADYHLAHAARADLCRRLGRNAEARVSYQRALTLTMQAPERRFLERRLTELGA